jgi:glucoamylase
MPDLHYSKMQSAVTQSDLPNIAQLMYWLMLRNVASEGIVYTDPEPPNGVSLPGCIVASPSYSTDEVSKTTQDYVYNWLRDSALAATEIALSGPTAGDGAAPQRLVDYVNFANTCQMNSAGDLSFAVYTIEGQPRPGWPHQNDGPALQTMAILRMFDRLDAATQDTARTVMQKNLVFLLNGDKYEDASFNLWEEVEGQSFFTLSVQLRCLTEIKNNTIGVAIPPGIDQAIDWLRKALDSHWNDNDGYYVSILNPVNPRDGHDPNIDIVMACVYGAILCTDSKVLATAAKVRSQWSDPGSLKVYPINLADAKIGLGPLMGRYPGDKYDGDNNDVNAKGHPWALCTANFAQLYYCVAGATAHDNAVPYDDLSAAFFQQVGVSQQTAFGDAVQLLKDAGDKMLQALVWHSDHFALSEQFDATTGFEKSVHDLTWSYAAFLSAVRARMAIP